MVNGHKGQFITRWFAPASSTVGDRVKCFALTRQAVEGTPSRILVFRTTATAPTVPGRQRGHTHVLASLFRPVVFETAAFG